MAINNSQNAVPAVELMGTMSTGNDVIIGTLTNNPVIIIFDNLGSNAVQIKINQITDVWKTFPAGEALVLDLRAAHGNAPNYTFPLGTAFYARGTTGDTFSISYIYAQN